MWNQKLVECARTYSRGTLTWVDAAGYPTSASCTAQFDDARQQVTLSRLPARPDGWQGSACLLFHRHNDQLEDFYEMVIKGQLSEQNGAIILTPDGFLTGTGRLDSDAM